MTSGRQAKAKRRAERKAAKQLASFSHRRKLARAERHLKNVEAALSDWASNGYRVFEEPNGEGRFVLRAEALKPLPDELPLVIGDAIQCLRHCLDHLIFTLSSKNPKMRPEDEDIPQFPIYNGAVRDNARPLRFLEKAVRDEVRSLAPDPARQPLDDDPLWLLNKLSNRDKHRAIIVTPKAETGASDYTLIASDGTDYFRSFGTEALEAGAKPVALAEFARSPGVQAEIGVSVNVLFDQGTEVADRPVVATLRWFEEHIRDTVLKRLEAHL